MSRDSLVKELEEIQKQAASVTGTNAVPAPAAPVAGRQVDDTIIECIERTARQSSKQETRNASGKRRYPMPAECPECAAEIELPEDTIQGEIIERNNFV